MPGAFNDKPNMRRTFSRSLIALARACGVILIVFAFASPALSGQFRHAGFVDALVAFGLIPAGVYLITRLNPGWGLQAAIVTLLVPVGSFWLVAGVVAFADFGVIEPNLGLIAAGSLMSVVGIGAAWSRQTTHTANSRPNRPFNLTVAYFLTRILGVFSITIAVALPVVAHAYPGGTLQPASISLALLPAGAFLATRALPRNAAPAVVATFLIPAGAVWFMSGAMAGADTGIVQPEIAKMAAGSALLAIAVGAAWSAWGPEERGVARLAVQTLAVAVWIVVATISVQTLDGPELVYIDVVAMELDGSDLIIGVPYQGGCGTSHLTVTTHRLGDVLEVTVTEPVGTMHCLAACLADWRFICTDQMIHHLDWEPPAGTRLVANHGPVTGLLRLPFMFLAAGLALGAGLWVTGKSRSAGGRS